MVSLYIIFIFRVSFDFKKIKFGVIGFEFEFRFKDVKVFLGMFGRVIGNYEDMVVRWKRINLDDY